MAASLFFIIGSILILRMYRTSGWYQSSTLWTPVYTKTYQNTIEKFAAAEEFLA